MGLEVILFLGSVREDRNCVRVGNFIKQQFVARQHKVHVFDPLEMGFPMLRKPLHFYRAEEEPPEWLRSCDALIRKADAFVAVAAEYNGCIAPALTNMMDHFPPESYEYKPCSIVCYSGGRYGGTTAGMQLRFFLGELGMVTPGFVFAIPSVQDAFGEDGTPTESNTVALSKAAKLIAELEWYARALKAEREKGLP